MDYEKLLETAVTLHSKYPPRLRDSVTKSILTLNPELTSSFLACIDHPLQILTCPTTGKSFIGSDYNRDGDSYRSPFSSEYVPPLAEGSQPPKNLRELEIEAQNVFATYSQLYYNGGISSSYFWYADEGTIACAVLFRNAEQEPGAENYWESSHLICIIPTKDKKNFIYNLTSTVIISIHQQDPNKNIDKFSLGGSFIREGDLSSKEGGFPVNNAKDHLMNIGQAIEEMENRIRGHIQEIYFMKCRDCLNDLRSCISFEDVAKLQQTQKKIASKMMERMENKP